MLVVEVNWRKNEKRSERRLREEEKGENSNFGSLEEKNVVAWLDRSLSETGSSWPQQMIATFFFAA